MRGPVGNPGRFAGVRDFWAVYRRNWAAVLGLVIALLYLVVAVAAPLLTPYDPLRLGPDVLQAPNRTHPMGTDDLGRDVFAGVIYGTRVSLAVGLIAAITSSVIGLVVGALAGFYRGWVDAVLMRVSEVFMIIPRFFFALILVAILGPSVWNIIAVIAFLSWPPTARLVRAEYLSLSQREFVQASRVLGASDLRIIFRHILPNAVPPAIVNGSLQVAQAILLEASLTFLGLGDPAVVSWGTLMSGAQRFLRDAWWIGLAPGIAISLAVLAFNLVGDGLTEGLNPKLKRR